MPSRYLRDGIIDSRRIGKLSEGAQLLYYKLLSLVDDYGRYSADPELLIIKAFPWAQSKYTTDEIMQRLNECIGESDPLLILYVVDGKPYLEIQDKQRRPLAAKSKFPSPTDTDGSRWIPTDTDGSQEGSPYTKSESNTKSNSSGLSLVDKPEPEEKARKPTKQPTKIEQEFEEDWPKFWVRVAKKEAGKAYEKARKEVSREILMAEVAKQGPRLLAEAHRKDITVVYPATWMNKGRWTDEDDAQPSLGFVPVVARGLTAKEISERG